MPRSGNARMKLRETDVPADQCQAADLNAEPKMVGKVNLPYPKRY